MSKAEQNKIKKLLDKLALIKSIEFSKSNNKTEDQIRLLRDIEEKLLNHANHLLNENSIEHPGCLIQKLENMNFYNYKHLEFLQALLSKVIPFEENDLTLFDDCFVIENAFNRMYMMLNEILPVADNFKLYFRRYNIEKKICVSNENSKSCNNTGSFVTKSENDELKHILTIKRGNSDNLLHEFFIAKFHLNGLRKYIPNFLLIYSLMKMHDKTYISLDMNDSLNNSDNNLFSYDKDLKIESKNEGTAEFTFGLVHERLTEFTGTLLEKQKYDRKKYYTLGDFETHGIDFDEVKWLSYYLQVILALKTANTSPNSNKAAPKFVHFNLNSDNILLLDGKRFIEGLPTVIEYPSFPLDKQSNENQSIYIKTDKIAVIINFEYSHFESEDITLKPNLKYLGEKYKESFRNVSSNVEPYRDIIHLTLSSLINFAFERKREITEHLLDFFKRELFMDFNASELKNLYKKIGHNERAVFILASFFNTPISINDYADKLVQFIRNDTSYSSILLKPEQFDNTLLGFSEVKNINFRFEDNYFLDIKSLSGVYKFGVQKQNIKTLISGRKSIPIEDTLYVEIAKRWRSFNDYIQKELNIPFVDFNMWEILSRENEFIKMYESIVSFSLVIIYWNDFMKNVFYLMNDKRLNLSKQSIDKIIGNQMAENMKHEITRFVDLLIDLLNRIIEKLIRLIDFDIYNFGGKRDDLLNKVRSGKTIKNVHRFSLPKKNSENVINKIKEVYSEKLEKIQQNEENDIPTTQKQTLSINALKHVIDKYPYDLEFVTSVREMFMRYDSIMPVITMIKNRL